MINLILSFTKKPFRDKVLIVKIMSFLMLGRILLFLPFKYMQHLLVLKAENRYKSYNESEILKKVSLYLEIISLKVPFKCTCMTKAFAGKMILKKYGVNSSIYFGIKKNSEVKKLNAHAWLKVNDNCLTGGGNIINDFKVINLIK